MGLNPRSLARIECALTIEPQWLNKECDKAKNDRPSTYFRSSRSVDQPILYCSENNVRRISNLQSCARVGRQLIIGQEGPDGISPQIQRLSFLNYKHSSDSNALRLWNYQSGITLIFFLICCAGGDVFFVVAGMFINSILRLSMSISKLSNAAFVYALLKNVHR